MNETTYKQWLPLHLRNAKGEPLAPEEQAFYEAGRDEIYAEEDLSGNAEELKRLRIHVMEMDSQLTQMMEQYRLLKAKAEMLESQLSEPVRRYIGVGD